MNAQPIGKPPQFPPAEPVRPQYFLLETPPARLPPPIFFLITQNTARKPARLSDVQKKIPALQYQYFKLKFYKIFP